MTLLSIILPFRNREHLLSETLESISSQEFTSHDNIELILVDNDSGHVTHELVEHWINELVAPWLKPVIVCEPETGASAARNRGIKESTSEWLYFFDSDDIMLPGHLKLICDAINRQPKSELIYWGIQYNVLSGKSTIKKPHSASLAHNVIIHGIWSTQRYVIKKTVLEKAGLWDTTLISRNDWELSIRLLLIKPNSTYISCLSPTVLVRANKNSLTGTTVFHNHESKEKAVLKALQYAKIAGSLEATILIETYGVVLCASYANQGSKELSKHFYSKITTNSRTPKTILYLCFLWQRIFRHGASLPSRLYLHIAKNNKSRL